MTPVAQWRRARGAARHVHDKEIVASKQPGMSFRERDGLLELVGEYVVLDEHNAPERFPVLMVFPPDYPGSEPIAVLGGDRFVRDLDHHFYQGPYPRMCLWLPSASLWIPRDGDALAGFLDQVTLFLDRQLVMEADPSLPYPGPEWPHGPEAYLEFLEAELEVPRTVLRRMARGLVGQQNPKATCPCGSGKNFRRCHQPGIDRFRFRLDQSLWFQLADALASRT